MTSHSLLSRRPKLFGALGLVLVLAPFGGRITGSLRSDEAPTAAASPACVPPPTNQPWTTPAEILGKNPDGSWKVSWVMVDQYLHSLTLLPPQLGEHNHLLRPVDPKYGAVHASILPYQGTEALCMDAFKRGVVVAKIEAEKDYPRLGLARGDNYYVVYRVGRRWHPLVLNPATRRELKRFVYKNHNGVAAGYEKTAFTRAAYECAVVRRLKACFVDSPSAQISPGSGPGGGLLFTRLFRWLFRQDGGSQPWAACPQFGCCCGGSNCHPDT